VDWGTVAAGKGSGPCCSDHCAAGFHPDSRLDHHSRMARSGTGCSAGILLGGGFLDQSAYRVHAAPDWSRPELTPHGCVPDPSNQVPEEDEPVAAATSASAEESCPQTEEEVWPCWLKGGRHRSLQVERRQRERVNSLSGSVPGAQSGFLLLRRFPNAAVLVQVR
jgi:hypothetical protein